MGIFDGWPFKSREERERESREFEARVFPLGPAQREAALAVLREVLSPKLRDTEALFAFISSKNSYILDGRSPESLCAARAKLERQGYIKKRDLDLIFALLRLDAPAESLNAYPRAEDVLRLAGQGGTGPAKTE